MMSPLVINRPLSNIHYRKSIIQAFNRIEINSQSGGRLALYIQTFERVSLCGGVYMCMVMGEVDKRRSRVPNSKFSGISKVWMTATPSRTW